MLNEEIALFILNDYFCSSEIYFPKNEETVSDFIPYCSGITPSAT